MTQKSELARAIDHTNLKPLSGVEDINLLVREALQLGVFSVCVASRYVEQCAAALRGSDTCVCAVVGFPLGHQSSEIKAFETEWCVGKGATEIDMVLDLAAIKGRAVSLIEKDISAVVRAARGHVVKVIIETCLLTDDEKCFVVPLIEKCGAQFVKTSTGFSDHGAVLEDVRLFKSLRPSLLIKASGGIRERSVALDFIAAGASRIGTSNAVGILG